MESLVRVAIIGCGRISGHHCRSILKTKSAKLVAVCDLDFEKAKAYEDQYGAKAYTNYHEMLSLHPEINTVAVITPSGMHYEHALEMIERYKKNVIVEKPTFLKASHFEHIMRAAKQAGVHVFPVFQNRHNHAVCRVKAAVLNGELGKVRVAAVRVRWCRPQRYYDLSPWRGTFGQDGGALTNQGVHHVDLLRYLVGDVKRVNSQMRTLGADIEVEDTVVAMVEFKNGAVGSLEVTTSARPNDYEASVSLVCENGLAQIGGIAVNELQVFTPDPSACLEHSEDFAGNVYGHGHEVIYREIEAHFMKTGAYSIACDDALATARLLNSFYLADERQSWVEVDDALDSIRLGRADEELAQLYRTPEWRAQAESVTSV